jgi:hypothetical protein
MPRDYKRVVLERARREAELAGVIAPSGSEGAA